MDNICHTLVGAALARTGLRSRTALASATMMIGANFPDIDILSAPFGRATEFRRGMTHGLPALVVLPFVLAGLMVLWDRHRRRRDPTRVPAVPRELLLLSAISIWTHPLLDWMNSYGMRWLMPFDGKWFYGDSLFIVDPYLMAALGAGVWLSRRRELRNSPRPWHPARIAVAACALYIATMVMLQNTAEGIARRQLAGTGRDREKLVVSPSAARPLRWGVHADDGDRYWTGHVYLLSRRLVLNPRPLEKGADDPAVAVAVRKKSARGFVDWARLPWYRVRRTPEETVVRITDMRYGAWIEIDINSPE